MEDQLTLSNKEELIQVESMTPLELRDKVVGVISSLIDHKFTKGTTDFNAALNNRLVSLNIVLSTLLDYDIRLSSLDIQRKEIEAKHTEMHQ